MLVGRPATLKFSLTVIGRPRSGWRQRHVSGSGGLPRPVEIAYDDGVDLGVDRLDPGDRGVD